MSRNTFKKSIALINFFCGREIRSLSQRRGVLANNIRPKNSFCLNYSCGVRMVKHIFCTRCSSVALIHHVDWLQMKKQLYLKLSSYIIFFKNRYTIGFCNIVVVLYQCYIVGTMTFNMWIRVCAQYLIANYPI